MRAAALLLAPIGAVAASAPAPAQTAMDRAMPGMTMPMPPVAPRRSADRKTSARKPPRPADPHLPVHPPGHRASTPPDATAGSPAGQTVPEASDATTSVPPTDRARAMPGMAMPAADAVTDRGSTPPRGTDLPPGTAPAPAASPGLAAARYYGRSTMAAADRALRREHGGMTYRQLLFNIVEYQARRGGDGYRWDGEGWIGGDVDRLVLKSEGEGTVGKRLDRGEAQVLYGHAVDPYWNLQAGVRGDVGRGRSRAYATLAIEGLAPYWFEVEGAVFVSGRGDVLARAEAWYDERVTRFVVVQPRLEANVAAHDTRVDGAGAGLTDLELGIRLRYEKSRELAPYVGIVWERQLGATARLARTRGNGTGGIAMVAGMRIWF